MTPQQRAKMEELANEARIKQIKKSLGRDINERKNEHLLLFPTFNQGFKAGFTAAIETAEKTKCSAYTDHCLVKAYGKNCVCETAAIEMQNEQIAQLQQDRESLKKLAADYKRKNGFANNHIKDLKEKLAASQEQLAKAEEALRFYADKNNWNSGRSLDDSRDVTVILDDDERTTNKFYYGGKRAREYFEAQKNEMK